MKFSNLMHYIDQLDEHIKVIRKTMMHVHPIGVDRLRHTVEEIEVIREQILNGQLVDSREINRLLRTARQCLRDCLNKDVINKAETLPKPTDDPWEPEITVTAVHLIFYLDISNSMFTRAGLHAGGSRRNMLVQFAKNVAAKAAEGGVPTKVSLIGYADPTHAANQPTFWQVALNKQPVSQLADGFANINRNMWKVGFSRHEEGITCMYKTLDDIVDHTIVNGEPTENVLILMSDERQRMAASEYPPHKRYPGSASAAQIQGKFSSHGIRSRFGLIPIKRGYANGGASSNLTGVKWNNDVKKLFTQSKDFWDVNKAASLNDWVKIALNPESGGN